MDNYLIMTDSACDLPGELAMELGVYVLPLTVNTGDGDYIPSTREEETQRFYDALRAGKQAFTAAVNPHRFRQAMAAALESGRDVICISFSSSLSATYQNACMAAAELRPQYPERRVVCVDSRCASMGLGLLVWLAARFRQQGGDLPGLEHLLEQTIPQVCHWFTVDNLSYLKRGGRGNAGGAPANPMLQLKPLLHVDELGRLVIVERLKGRRAAIQRMADKVAQEGRALSGQTIFISHGDCPQDAQYLAELLRRQVGPRDIIIGRVGAVIGSHSGPETLAVFFLGEHR